MIFSNSSWLPKLGGVIAGLGGALLIGGGLGGPHALLWVGPALAAFGASLSGLTSRQDNRSSEQVGAGPKAGAS